MLSTWSLYTLSFLQSIHSNIKTFHIIPAFYCYSVLKHQSCYGSIFWIFFQKFFSKSIVTSCIHFYKLKNYNIRKQKFIFLLTKIYASLQIVYALIYTDLCILRNMSLNITFSPYSESVIMSFRVLRTWMHNFSSSSSSNFSQWQINLQKEGTAKYDNDK